MEYKNYIQKTDFGKIKLYQADCMEMLPQVPDKYYDLCICDPPYGIGMDGGKTYKRPSRPNSYSMPPKHEKRAWDSRTPDEQYFQELFRVSANQIMWGGNYFVEFLNPSMGWIYWGKMEDASDFSDGELAFTSFPRALKSIRMHQFTGTHGGKDRIHPTQKPVALYQWLLKNYAKPGDKILDTHGGSFSSAIACDIMGFDFTGYEIDLDYYKSGLERFNRHKQQTVLEFG